MKIIATDLDRTLIPNGNHRLSKGAMDFFKKKLKDKDIKLIYVTGRYKKLISDGIKRYELPKPHFCISLLGTVIYDFRKRAFKEDKDWQKKLKEDWKQYKRKDIALLLENLSEIKQQEKIKLNDFKQSYYFNPAINTEKLTQKIETILKSKQIKTEIITSIDVNRNKGLLDIVPETGTKMAALNYITKKLRADKNHVLYCGDSGNDLLPLTSGVKGILVKNASYKTKERLKKLAKQKNLESKVYIAKGNFKGFNGNYVAGIIEGAYKLNFFKEE